tara:strand:+ start:239 stop:688 length:450 start_codon:yes stop_codon:yes gene_type:complete
MKPFQPARIDITIREIMDRFDLTKTKAREMIKHLKNPNLTQWINDTYSVGRYDDGDIIHLSIKRIDKEPIHDWRDLQEIKNILVGKENEAVEIYPAESRRVDMVNQFHLWCFANPEMRVPLGFNDGRVVVDHDPNDKSGGKQRPLDEEV